MIDDEWRARAYRLGRENAALLASRDAIRASLAELLEICRWKCGPNDEVVLKSGRTNHQALVDAHALLVPN